MPRLTGFSPVAVPGPRAVPVLGATANMIGFFADPVGRMLSLHKTWGSEANGIVGVARDNPGMVCAFGAAWNQHVITRPEVFAHSSEVPIKAPTGSALARFNQVLPFKNGEEHKRRRRLMMPAFARDALAGYAPGIVDVATTVVSRWPLGPVVDVSALCRELTAAVTLRSLFGLNTLDGSDTFGHLVAGLLDALTSPLSIMLPLQIPGLPFHAAVSRAELVQQRLQQILDDKRRDGCQGNDVLSILLRAQGADGLSDDELLGEANGLFVAGYDTSAQTLMWTLFLLAQHPDILDAVYDELDAVLGPPGQSRAPVPDDADRLVLLNRVILESMRLLPAGPMLFMRECTMDTRLGDVALPAGATVVLSTLVTHRDPVLYPEPACFRPARWETLEPAPWEYLPFGAGARMCLGAAFAKQSLRLLLPVVLQRLRPSVVDGTVISRKVRGIALGAKAGLSMRLLPREARVPPRATVRGDIHELVTL